MLKKINKTALLFLNIAIFFVLSHLIANYLWETFGKSYVYGPPVGSDYYNALTYLIHLHKSVPPLPAGWFPFWNGGTPFVGGYPFYVFYLLQDFFNYFDPFILMNAFSLVSLTLFFVFSLLLFRQVSKNWIIAAGLTFILINSRSSYYQLTTGGFIISASIQWYLPLCLLLIYKFYESKKLFYLLLASIICGISILQQAPSALLMVFAPSFIALFSFTLKNKLKEKLLIIAIFSLLSLSIGTLGLYTVYLQTFFGSGSGSCISRECWGDYPAHFDRWLNPFALIVAAALLLFATLLKIAKKQIQITFLAPSIAGLAFCLLYGLFAYFHLINGLANIIFPTRIFWVGHLFLLLAAASAFALIGKVVKVFYHPLAIIITLTVFLTFLQKPVQIHNEFPATVPFSAHLYAVPRFQTISLSNFIPDWVIKSEKNFRWDIVNSGINQWYYLISDSPTTQGYSNHALGSHRDWQYFLETSTRNIEENRNNDNELAKNRTLFLLDAYGIGIVENSRSKYPNFLTNDSEIFTNTLSRRTENDREWYKVNPDIATPIVAPINSTPVLFVGDDASYNLLVRTLAMTNLNSKKLVLVKGPDKINKLDTKTLSSFPALVLYKYKDSPKNLQILESFIKSGGKVFIDTASTKFEDNLPEMFPGKKLTSTSVQEKIDFKKSDSKITKDIKSETFSVFTYQSGPWAVSTIEELRQNTKELLSFKNKVVLAQTTLGKGEIIWSGLNLPFHIIENDNLEEGKLLQNIILDLVKTDSDTPTFNLSRDTPEKIIITGKNIKGVYFKENYHEGWQAKVNGKQVKIYEAGPAFMYIRLPEEKENNTIINIDFTGGLIDWSLYYFSICSLAFSILFLIFTPFSVKITRKVSNHLGKKILKIFKNIVNEAEDF